MCDIHDEYKLMLRIHKLIDINSPGVEYRGVGNAQVYDIDSPDVECKGVENTQVYDINSPDAEIQVCRKYTSI